MAAGLRSSLAPTNQPLWKVYNKLDGVVRSAVLNQSLHDCDLLVVVRLQAICMLLSLLPRFVGLALELAVKQPDRA